MWILILTLVVKPTQPGAAIVTAEFSSELRCKAAAEAWLREQRKIPDSMDPRSAIYPSAVCSYK